MQKEYIYKKIKTQFVNKYFIVFVIFIAFNIEGRVISSSLNQLIKASDFIVIARVVNIDKERADRIFATARVDSILYGNPPDSIKFRAYPTWTCDESKAVKDENILLFAKKCSNKKCEIAWHGRGRMPIIIRSDSLFISLLPDVIYTYDIINNSFADTIHTNWGSYLNRYAAIDKVVNAIKENIKCPGQPLWNSFVGPDMFVLDNYFKKNHELTESDLRMMFDGRFVSGANAKTLQFLLGDPTKKCLYGDQECWLYKKSKSFISVKNGFIQDDTCLCK